MAIQRTTSTTDSPTLDAPSQRPKWSSKTLLVLTIVVAVETLLVIGLAVAVGFLCGERSSRVDGEVVTPSAADQEAWMLGEQMAVDVGYFIQDNDRDGYLDLYDPADPHVDFASVESAFDAVAQKAQEAGEAVEYMTTSMPIIYEDKSTGETLVRVAITGRDFESGRPAGGRLTMYLLVNEDGEATLTGREGRELKVTSTVW